MGAWLLIFLLGCSWAYWVLAWWCTQEALRRREAGDAGFRPPVSILKPVRGLDAEARENFASFCNQDYPDYEILFGVADANDPAAPIVGRLQREFPNRKIRLIIGADENAANPKVAILSRLSSQATGDVLVISDSDVRVDSDYLKQVVEPLGDQSIGLVTCPYRGEMPRSLPAKLESLQMAGTFVPSAILAARLTRTPVGLGATLALRASDLKRAGGLESIRDHLADDYQLAARIKGLGLKVRVSSCAVMCVLGQVRFAEQWRRELRWARAIHVSRPLGYLGMPITFSTALGLLSFAVMRPGMAAGLVAISLLLRMAVAWGCLVQLGSSGKWQLVYLPTRDLMSVAVWIGGIFGRRVRWRDRAYRLLPDGRLAALAHLPLPLFARLLAPAVRRLDRYLCRRQGIYEFSSDPQCILRISRRTANVDAVLEDGTRVSRGEPIGEIHFWNEHIPTMSETGPDLMWAIAFHRRLCRSLEQLAIHVQDDPRLSGVRAIYVRANFGPNDRIDRTFAGYGFEPVRCPDRDGLRRRWHDFFERFLLWGLLLAYNPGGLKFVSYARRPRKFWMSMTNLLSHTSHFPPASTSKPGTSTSSGAGM